jgi:hypothetical protein
MQALTMGAAVAIGAAALVGCPSPAPAPGVTSAENVEARRANAEPRAATTSAAPPPKAAFADATDCSHRGSGRDYEVGPGKRFEKLGDVPFERLAAGDTVRIHHRREPYREKLMIGGVGRPDAPIRVCGVRGPGGERPVIDGDGATTRPSLVFPYDGHQVRGLIIVGWRRSDPWKTSPEHIVIEGLELRNASPKHRFTDKSGKAAAYAQNAAGIFVQRGRNVTLRGNVVHDNGNGLFVGTAGGDELTEHVLIEGNYVYDNGSDENYYHHNVYNEASGVVYQFNHFGPPKAGPKGILGANIKERSAGVVIRYNWIEDGAHVVDLVDAQEAREPNLKSASFRESWMYGNVVVRGPAASGSMIHYGGDSGLEHTYRKGTLRFFHNTVVIENAAHKDWEGTAIFELSTNDERLDSRNNVYVSDAPRPSRPVALLGARDGVVSGKATFAGDWIREGISATAGHKAKVVATPEGLEGGLRGKDPGFVGLARRDFHLAAGCPFVGKGVPLAFPEHPLGMQYAAHGKGEARPNRGAPTPGAFSP